MSGDGSPTAQPTIGTLAIAGVLVVVLVAGFIALSLAGRDTGTYTLFVAGPLVTTVVGAILARRVAVTEQLARTAVEQTNGSMSQQFDGVHVALEEQTSTLLQSAAIAPAAPAPVAPAAGGPAGHIRRLPVQAPPGVGTDQPIDVQAVPRLP